MRSWKLRATPLPCSADTVEREFKRGGEFQFQLLRYMQVLLAQMAQTAVCNRHHSVEQQLCRWLLLSLQRIESDELQVTQELIATKLGVRREGVTEAAGRLQEAGLIKYSRGKITGTRPGRSGTPQLRVLPGGQKGVQPTADCHASHRPWDAA